MLILLCIPRQASSAEKLNIIFIFADEWGYGDLSRHGSSFCQTPHLVRIASEGVDFQNCTVNSPVCSPSRVDVMMGQFPARHCVNQHFQSVKAHIKRGMPDWLDPQAPMLQEAGYKKQNVLAHHPKVARRLSERLDAWKNSLPDTPSQNSLSKSRN